MKALSIRWSGLRGQMMTAFALRGAAAAFSFALSWLIARQFGAEGVGNFSLALTTAVLGATVALVGLEYVLLRTVAVEHGQGRSGTARGAIRGAVWQAGALALLLAIALLLARDLIAVEILNEPQVAPFLGVMALAIPIVALAKLASAALRAIGRIAMSQAIDGPIGTGAAAAVFGVAILAGLPLAPLAPAILYCLFAAVAAALGWIVLRRAMRDWDAAQPYTKAAWRAGLPILGVTVTGLFTDWFATMILGSTAGTADVGLYRIAFQIVAMLALVRGTVDSILGPVIASAYANGDNDRIASVALKASGAMIALASPLLLIIAVAPDWLMGLFGAEFVAGATALQILAVGQTINLAVGPVGTILIMTHHEKWSLAYAVVAAVISAGLLWWLVPLYGVVGAAIGVTLTLAARNLAALLIVRYVVGIHFFTGKAS